MRQRICQMGQYHMYTSRQFYVRHNRHFCKHLKLCSKKLCFDGCIPPCMPSKDWEIRVCKNKVLSQIANSTYITLLRISRSYGILQTTTNQSSVSTSTVWVYPCMGRSHQPSVIELFHASQHIAVFGVLNPVLLAKKQQKLMLCVGLNSTIPVN